MKKTLQLSIPQPCTQSWGEMSPQADGRFCLACQKPVTDFSAWNEEQLKQFFRSHTGEVCGKFRADQLKQYPLTSPSNLLAKFAGFAFVGLTATAALAQDQGLSGGKPILITRSQLNDVAEVAGQAENPSDSLDVVIRGQVWEEGFGALPGVSVLVKGTSTGTATDAQGRFELRLRLPHHQPVELAFSYIGFESLEKIVDWKEGTSIDLGKEYMIPEVHVLGGVAMGRISPLERLWWQIKSIF